MPALSIPSSSSRDVPPGFAAASPSMAAAHRAGLGRGIAFVLILAATSLAAVCAPVVCQGPHWVDGTAPAAAEVIR